MQILNSNFNISPLNYHKPTPLWVKYVADVLLLIAMIAEVCPEFPGKQWVVFGGIALKFISKFITDHTV